MYLHHGEKDADGPASSLSGWKATSILGKIQALDDDVQR